jgi:hypothetical protein
MDNNENHQSRPSLRRLVTWAAAGLTGAALAFACTSTPAAVYTTSDYYAYDYYYPADVSYYSTYWVDDWYVDPFYYGPIRQAQTYQDAGVAVDGGTGAPGVSGVGIALRALARGDSVCPGQVTVVPKTGQGCTLASGPGTVRTGATVTFNGCMLSGGGRIDGMVDLTSTPTPSDQNCDANTIINVSYTATYTDLSYRAPSGTRVVIPSQTDQGTYMRNANAGPTAISFTTNGSLQRYDASNALVANHNYNGSRNYTISRPNDVLTAVVNGALMVQDVAGGNPVTITGTGITRTASCCHPTAGTLAITRDDTAANWTFGPSCGQATANGTSTTLSACE